MLIFICSNNLNVNSLQQFVIFTFKLFLFLTTGAASKSYWLNLSRDSRKLRQTALTNNKATGHNVRRHKYHTLNKVSFDVFLVATLCGCLLCSEIIFLFSEYLFLSSPFPSFIVSFISPVCPILLPTTYVVTAIAIPTESLYLAVLYNAWVSFITNTNLITWGLFDRASSSWKKVKCQLDATR